MVGHQLMTRLAADGHNVTLLTAQHTNNTVDAPYKIVRGGNRFTVYLWAARYYIKHLRNKTTLVIDECNTVPFFAGWYAGCKHVTLFHMLCRKIWFYELPQPLSTIGWLLEPVYLRLLKRGPVITVSNSTKQDLIRQGFNAKDIHIISEGLELEPAKDLNTTKYDKPTVLSLGSMRNMKQTLDQVQAFEIAKDSMPDLQMRIAGASSDAYGKKVLDYIEASRYKDSIHYEGRVSQSEKVSLMRKCHALLVTSVKEGWGLVVTEANSQGTPAIGYNVDGLRDSIVNSKTGIVCDTYPAALAKGIINLLTDAPKYDRIRVAAYAHSKGITFTKAYADFKEGIQI